MLKELGDGAVEAALSEALEEHCLGEAEEKVEAEVEADSYDASESSSFFPEVAHADRLQLEAAETLAAAEELAEVLETLKKERSQRAATLTNLLTSNSGALETEAIGIEPQKCKDIFEEFDNEEGQSLPDPSVASFISSRSQLQTLEERTAEAGRLASSLKQLLKSAKEEISGSVSLPCQKVLDDQDLHLQKLVLKPSPSSLLPSRTPAKASVSEDESGDAEAKSSLHDEKDGLSVGAKLSLVPRLQADLAWKRAFFGGRRRERKATQLILTSSTLASFSSENGATPSFLALHAESLVAPQETEEEDALEDAIKKLALSLEGDELEESSLLPPFPPSKELPSIDETLKPNTLFRDQFIAELGEAEQEATQLLRELEGNTDEHCI